MHLPSPDCCSNLRQCKDDSYLSVWAQTVTGDGEASCRGGNILASGCRRRLFSGAQGSVRVKSILIRDHCPCTLIVWSLNPLWIHKWLTRSMIMSGLCSLSLLRQPTCSVSARREEFLLSRAADYPALTYRNRMVEVQRLVVGKILGNVQKPATGWVKNIIKKKKRFC